MESKITDKVDSSGHDSSQAVDDTTTAVAYGHQQAPVPENATTAIPGVVSAGEAARIITRRRIVEQSSYDGPMPHPDILKKYGEIVADAPERILKVFEADSEHSRVITLAALNAQKNDNSRVQWMAWSLIVGGYGMAALFAAMNKDVLAGIVLTSTIVGTVVGFLQGKRKGPIDQLDESEEE